MVATERNGPGTCLICLSHDGGFTTVEHPIPESIGNTTLVLPPGVVCDRCNTGELSDLDQHLAEFFPIMVRRTTLAVPSKAGKIPVTRVYASCSGRRASVARGPC